MYGRMHIYIMNTEDFEKLVADSIKRLSEKTQKKISNVAFLVEDDIRNRRHGERDIKIEGTSLGLYEGIPRTKRGEGYTYVLPDRITIFQKPIEDMCGGDLEKIKEMVYEVVWHEVGHHFGFGEAEIRKLENKKFRNKK
jgi:predicted Zn-dependent protease with MMP-like domain